MADSRSLLSLIAQNDSRGLEDAATDALRFILSRSPAARRSLSELLTDVDEPLPIAKVQTWAGTAHGAVPDLACYDGDDNLVAFVESKFWAPLTHHQPVTYWQELPSDRPAVLLFLAPDSRVEEPGLWDELVRRLRNAGHSLGLADRQASVIAAPSTTGSRRLMLTSWEFLLNQTADTASVHGEAQACFEVAELQGLAGDAIAGDSPRSNENLKELIREAVKCVEQLDWANTDRLNAGPGYDYYARYLRLAGASAGLVIHYEAMKQMPDKPLWLWFWPDRDAQVSEEVVRTRLGEMAEPGCGWLREKVCVPILLPVAADREASLKAIIAQLTCIASLIDPNGPTYRKSV